MELLLLGGTTEASGLAQQLSERRDIRATLSLAGRTREPLRAPLPTRSGGFGGVDGLANHLARHRIDVVVDATHPFAARMSDHAVQACRRLGIPLVRLSRAPWQPVTGDRWIHVADVSAAAGAVTALGPRVFLSVGGHSLQAFEAVPGKSWLVRSIDPPQPPPAFSDWQLIRARGPFTFADEVRLLREHRVDTLVTKNSGGVATRPKLDAARELGLPVVMIDRPALPEPDAAFDDPDALLAWLDAGMPRRAPAHAAGQYRGV